MKNLLITGASGGLGQGIIEQFKDNQVKVLATYSHSEQENSNYVQWIEWSTSNLFSFENLIKKLDDYLPLDGWIHLTGGFLSGFQLEETPLQKLKLMMEINFESFASLVPVVLPFRQPEHHLSVVVIGSLAGLSPTAGLGAYGVSKSALSFYTEVLRRELKGQNFSINMIVPSIIDTVSNREAVPDADFEKWVKPTEIGHIIEFLLSEQNKKITGSVIRIGE